MPARGSMRTAIAILATSLICDSVTPFAQSASTPQEPTKRTAGKPMTALPAAPSQPRCRIAWWCGSAEQKKTAPKPNGIDLGKPAGVANNLPRGVLPPPVRVLVLPFEDLDLQNSRFLLGDSSLGMDVATVISDELASMNSFVVVESDEVERMLVQQGVTPTSLSKDPTEVARIARLLRVDLVITGDVGLRPRAGRRTGAGNFGMLGGVRTAADATIRYMVVAAATGEVVSASSSTSSPAVSSSSRSGAIAALQDSMAKSTARLRESRIAALAPGTAASADVIGQIVAVTGSVVTILLNERSNVDISDSEVDVIRHRAYVQDPSGGPTQEAYDVVASALLETITDSTTATARIVGAREPQVGDLIRRRR